MFLQCKKDLNKKPIQSRQRNQSFFSPLQMINDYPNYLLMCAYTHTKILWFNFFSFVHDDFAAREQQKKYAKHPVRIEKWWWEYLWSQNAWHFTSTSSSSLRKIRKSMQSQMKNMKLAWKWQECKIWHLNYFLYR